MISGYSALAVAILAEVIGTTALKASDGFTRPAFCAVVVAGYAVAFTCLARTLRTVPVGIAYALWSGIGTVLICAIGWVAFRQRLDAAALLGVGLIVAGVLVINLLSASVR